MRPGNTFKCQCWANGQGESDSLPGHGKHASKTLLTNVFSDYRRNEDDRSADKEQ